jgi:hypothetical protein
MIGMIYAHILIVMNMIFGLKIQHIMKNRIKITYINGMVAQGIQQQKLI